LQCNIGLAFFDHGMAIQIEMEKLLKKHFLRDKDYHPNIKFTYVFIGPQKNFDNFNSTNGFKLHEIQHSKKKSIVLSSESQVFPVASST